jgi:PAS domain S-box-containing protein
LITSPLVGDQRVAARVPIPGVGWVAGATRPLSVVGEPLRRALLRDVILGLLVAALAFAAAALAARTIAEPIRRLERDARAMGAGTVETSPDLQAPTEVANLRRTVTRMAATLLDRAEALRQAKDRLQTQTEELRQSEARHRRLIENLKGSHFVYVHDTNGCSILSVSITAILGYSSQEFMTHYDTYLTDHPANRAVRRHTELSIQGIRQPPYEVHVRHKDGSTRWLEVQEVPVFDAQGKVIAVEGVAQDITERKHAEEALRESERYFRTLANATPQLVWTADPDGRVDYYNERYKEYSGIERKPDGGFQWAPVLHPDDVAATVRAWDHAVRTGEPYQIEHRVQRADRTYHWHRAGLPPQRRGRVVKWSARRRHQDIKQGKGRG